MEKVIKYLLAFMWITYLLDHFTTVVGLELGHTETNQLFHIGGWALMIGYNFLHRSIITIYTACVQTMYPHPLALALAISVIGFLVHANMMAAVNNVGVILGLR